MIKKGHINYSGILFAIAGLLCLSFLLMSAGDKQYSGDVSGVHIHIHEELDHVPFIDRAFIIDELIAYFNDDLTERELVDIDPFLIEEVLSENVYLKEVNTHVDANRHVHIQVKERIPVLRVITGIQDVYIDAEGVVLPIKRGFNRRVPVVTGQTAYKRVDDFNIETLTRLAQIIDADPFIKALIEQYYFNGRHEIYAIPKLGHQKIKIGQPVDIEKKLEKIKTFYKEGLPRIGWDKYETFDFDYKGQVVCKKKINE